ncbi:hypothetical protein SPRG_03632 [Saprolegnia parasitica CBS 223.65]|uniref:Helicase-associated domain-containing protein n=1 Tax=Saprolegnia parasitica (strain CBS 223.65) TaxID=695850 RepID=A0A067CM22_SAPPC|nr:hypothetical protein SPRG_03632 [Saprolegnia parasitica CBS 223.65]KDO31714.1 hypothetical protein SPRG_03632 [Saprolegnia parasitica CBS 223.65]|eukprot:XP_012197597.1 hypothetical protein SPRG_03632 [Saprolegnia parasitica CBS 223.65]
MLRRGHSLARAFGTLRPSRLLPAPLVDGLAMFQREHGHFIVPRDHVSPDGFPLGQKLQGLIRKLPTISRERSHQLATIGFPLEWHAYLLDTAILPALQTYKAVFGDLWVPQKFVVPTGDTAWPAATWGLRLGERVSNLRKTKNDLPTAHAKALDAEGFVWHARNDRLYTLTLPALRAYRDIHKSPHVPNAFVVPSQLPWPSELHGYKLGHAMMALKAKHRLGTLPTDVLAALHDVDLDLDQTLREAKWNDVILPSLHVYFSLYGHCDVEQAFLVPAGGPWPAAATDLALGRIVRDLRSAGTYSEFVERDESALRALGFVWSQLERMAFTIQAKVIPAMAVYRAEHGHAFVPSNFVVPATQPWPTLSHHMKLGLWIARTRSELDLLPHNLQFLLEESGIVWRHFDERFENVVLPAVKTYSELHGSCEDISSSFHVPSHAPWPEAAWGLNLGGTLWHIRNGDSYIMDPKKLRALRKFRGLVL